MVSSTHAHDQIMVSKEITHASSSNNPYGLSKNDIGESSSAKTYDLSKPKDDNVKNKEIVDATVLDNNNELFHVEEEAGWEYVNTCDTCGDLGWRHLLAICGKCKVGAQHTYCMTEKADKVSDDWSCYECTKNQDQMLETGRNEETSSRKRKAESFIEVAENKRRPGLLNAQNSCRLFGVDLSMDLSTDQNKEANTDLKKHPGKDSNTQNNCILFGVDLSRNLSPDRNKDANTDLKKYPGKDLNTQNNCKLFGVDLNKCRSKDCGHNPNMNMDPTMGILLPPSFKLGSSSTFKLRTNEGVSNVGEEN